MKNKKYLFLLPLTIAISIVIGVFIGKHFNIPTKSSSAEKKLNTILNLIENNYVDTIDIDELVEMTLPKLMASLDPHSSYIPKKDLIAVNEDLAGSFSGVGISFQIINDTITIIEIITGGPAQKVGLQAGDRILTVNDSVMVGEDITNEDVFKNLRGEKGSKVKLGIKRSSSKNILTYDVIRDDVPVNSVNSYYMLTNNIGYIKIDKFAKNTYTEFFNALIELHSNNATKFIIDLRDNPGGFMDQAILMANEFLPKGNLVVYTKARTPENEMIAISDGTGQFLNTPIAILTNEYSASASEIFAGAMQDNDRGLVIGRRTFGKGLVQNQTELNDSSAIRLTVARYYTPSGRSIQKEYERGKGSKYENDITDRYIHGEFYNQDSVKLDKNKVFKTSNGRTVYGGGGIMPDKFIPEDTTDITSYYINVANSGLIQKFAFKIADNYRNSLKQAKTIDDLQKLLPSDEILLFKFVDFAKENGIPKRWYYINQSKNLILRQIKAMVARDILGFNEFYQIFNQNDKTIEAAKEYLETTDFPIIKN